MNDQASSSPDNKDVTAKAKLIAEAGKLFAEFGFEGVSTREIAKAAEVNISLISYYFEGKEGLYLAVFQDFAVKAQMNMNTLVDELKNPELNRKSFEKTMKTIVATMVRLKLEAPYASILMMREVLSGMPHTKAFFDSTLSTMAEGLIQFLEIAQKKGFLRADIHCPTLFISLVHSVDTYALASRCDTVLSRKLYKIPKDIEKFIEQMQRIFIEGVLK